MNWGIKFYGQLLSAVLVVGLEVRTATAVIKADLPLGKVYKDSQEIVIGKIQAVDADNNVAQLHEVVGFSELNKYLKKKDRSLILHLDKAKILAGKLKTGEPVVIFVAGKSGAVHVGDQWYLAAPATGANWTLVEKQNLGVTFPGTTPSLVRALMLLRAEKAPILDNIEHSTWTKGFQLQKLDAVGRVMASADSTGDRKPSLVLLTEKGAKFHRSPGDSKPFEEMTDQVGLSGATATQVAFVDVDGDGKADLLLDELFWNRDGKFVRSKSGIDLKGKNLLAVALMDATGDGKPDAIVLASNGTSAIYGNPGKDEPWPKKSEARIWQDPETRFAAHIAAWGDDGKPHVMTVEKGGPVRYSMAGEAADFKRLTGIAEPMFRGKPRHFPIDDFQASTAWDRLGGDGYPDLLIATKRGGLADLELIGRGHGAFFYNNEGHIGVTVEGKRRYRPNLIAMAPADIDGNGTLEMLLLDANGVLWVNFSPFFVAGAPIDAPPKKK